MFWWLASESGYEVALFDHTVRPVVLYGSEIWDTSNTTTISVRKGSFNPFYVLSDLPCKNLHIIVLKYVSIERQQNATVLSELGRCPIAIEILCNTIKCVQCLNSERTNLLAGALKVRK